VVKNNKKGRGRTTKVNDGKFSFQRGLAKLLTLGKKKAREGGEKVRKNVPR